MTDATRPASDDEHDVHAAASAIDHEIARLKKERDTLLAPVREVMERDGTTALLDPDTGKALFRLDDVARDVLDEDGLVSEHPEVEVLLAKHTVQRISRRFTVARVHRAAVAA